MNTKITSNLPRKCCGNCQHFTTESYFCEIHISGICNNSIPETKPPIHDLVKLEPTFIVCHPDDDASKKACYVPIQ